MLKGCSQDFSEGCSKILSEIPTGIGMYFWYGFLPRFFSGILIDFPRDSFREFLKKCFLGFHHGFRDSFCLFSGIPLSIPPRIPSGIFVVFHEGFFREFLYVFLQDSSYIFPLPSSGISFGISSSGLLGFL